MRLFSDASLDVPDVFLRRAFELAESGRGTTSPNPMAGCVVVSDGRIVGEGWHRRAGEAHAEALALDAAGDAAVGGDVYVTLEPCNHHGRTPPCTEALIAARVASVTAGMPDPDPRVEGGGVRALRAAGIDARFASDPAPFEEQNAEWLVHIATGRPFVRVKAALTLDGHPALTKGHRARLTGPEAASLTARLRSVADAVMVGAATCVADDPRLTVRDAAGEEGAAQPLRVVLGRTSAPSPCASVFTAPGRAIVLLADDADAAAVAPLEASGIEVLRYDAAGGPRAALAILGGLDVVSVLAETGPGLLGALMEDDLVDEMVMYHAGGMAGDGAPALYRGAPDATSDALVARFRAVEAGLAGGDAVTVWRPYRDRHGADA